MKENRFRWFGHIMRREDSEAVSTGIMELGMEGRRGMGKTKKEMVERD